MIWDEARWDGKIKEKWGKSYPDEGPADMVVSASEPDLPRPHFDLSLFDSTLVDARSTRSVS